MDKSIKPNRIAILTIFVSVLIPFCSFAQVMTVGSSDSSLTVSGTTDIDVIMNMGNSNHWTAAQYSSTFIVEGTDNYGTDIFGSLETDGDGEFMFVSDNTLLQMGNSVTKAAFANSPHATSTLSAALTIFPSNTSGGYGLKVRDVADTKDLLSIDDDGALVVLNNSGTSTFAGGVTVSTSSGAFGVGTTSPGAKFAVGNAYANGGLYFNSTGLGIGTSSPYKTLSLSATTPTIVFNARGGNLRPWEVSNNGSQFVFNDLLGTSAIVFQAAGSNKFLFNTANGAAIFGNGSQVGMTNALNVTTTGGSGFTVARDNLGGVDFSVQGNAPYGNGGNVRFFMRNQATFLAMQDTTQTDFFLYASSTNNVVFRGGFRSTGKVGVGATTTPWALLSVNATSTSLVPLFAVASSTGVSTSTVFLITSLGKVGVGTSSPFQQLSVQGGVLASTIDVTSSGTSTFYGNVHIVGNLTLDSEVLNNVVDGKINYLVVIFMVLSVINFFSLFIR